LLVAWVVFECEDLTKRPTAEAVRRGLSLTPADSPIFWEFTTGENLELGGPTGADARIQQQRLERVHETPHSCSLRRDCRAPQRRAAAAALHRHRADERREADAARRPSLGIAPSLVQELITGIRELS